MSTTDLMEPAPRCTAARHRYHPDEPCERAPVPGATVCDWHGGSARQVKAKARERLQPAVDRAVEVLARLVDSPDPMVREQARAALARFGQL